MGRTATPGTSIGAVTVEAIVTRGRIIDIRAGSTVAGIGGTHVGVDTIGIYATTTTGRIDNTDISIRGTTKVGSNIVLTNQISETIVICIAISLTYQARAFRLAEFTITMRFSGTTAAATGRITSIARLVADVPATARITGVGRTGTPETSIGAVTVEAIVTRGRVIDIRTGSAVAGIGGTDVGVVTIGIYGTINAARIDNTDISIRGTTIVGSNIVLTNQISETVFICIAISLTYGAAIRRTGRAILERFADAIVAATQRTGYFSGTKGTFIDSELVHPA
jgi:hypothetical protein